MTNTKFIIKHALILFAIAFICSLLLILCNNLTKGRIAELQAKTEAEAQAAVLSDATEFEAAEKEGITPKTYREAANGDFVEVGT